MDDRHFSYDTKLKKKKPHCNDVEFGHNILIIITWPRICRVLWMHMKDDNVLDKHMHLNESSRSNKVSFLFLFWTCHQG